MHCSGDPSCRICRVYSTSLQFVLKYLLCPGWVLSVWCVWCWSRVFCCVICDPVCSCVISSNPLDVRIFFWSQWKQSGREQLQLHPHLFAILADTKNTWKLRRKKTVNSASWQYLPLIFHAAWLTIETKLVPLISPLSEVSCMGHTIKNLESLTLAWRKNKTVICTFSRLHLSQFCEFLNAFFQQFIFVIV